MNKENSKETTGSVTQNIINNILTNENMELFHCQSGEGYLFDNGENPKNIKIKDNRFEEWLSRGYWNNTGSALGREASNTVARTLEGLARYDSPQRELHMRVSMKNGVLTYDLGGKEHKIVKVHPGQWYVEKFDGSFHHYDHMVDQAIPVPGGDFKDLLKYVNITNPDDQLLFMVWVITSMIPGRPQPIAYIYGPEGSAKSSLSTMMRDIIDPTNIGISQFPNGDRDLVIQLSQSWVSIFDNVSKIDHVLSDKLCRACTGTSFTTRKLYSNSELEVFTFMVPIIINGINLLAAKPDLLERSILFELERIPDEKRMLGEKLVKEFSSQKGYFLGAAFDIISKAMTFVDDIELTSSPRMADFTRWGCAIAQCLGYTQEDFLAAYQKNIKRQQEIALESNSMAYVLIDFMKEKRKWSGTATKLLNDLRFSDASNEGYELPKTAVSLGRMIKQVAVTLKKEGIEIKQGRSTEKRSIVIINSRFNDGMTDMTGNQEELCQ